VRMTPPGRRCALQFEVGAEGPTLTAPILLGHGLSWNGRTGWCPFPPASSPADVRLSSHQGQRPSSSATGARAQLGQRRHSNPMPPAVGGTAEAPHASRAGRLRPRFGGGGDVSDSWALAGG
jgi:hypothetical protein